MTPDAATLVDRVKAGLKNVIDPEIGRDVVSLGLIYHIEADAAGSVHISMTTTTPDCPAAGFLVEGVRYAAASVAGVETVEVELTYEPRWKPEMMSA